MPDPLMDTLDEIDRKSGTLLVTEGTSLQPRHICWCVNVHQFSFVGDG